MNQKQKKARLKHLNQLRKFNRAGVKAKRHKIQSMEDLLLPNRRRINGHQRYKAWDKNNRS